LSAQGKEEMYYGENESVTAMNDVLKLTKVLQGSWSSETSNWGGELPADNPARGQCVVSSLVVQDYLGGELVRVHAIGDGIDEKHYFNQLPDGTILDTTGMQYKKPVTFTVSPVDLEKKGYSTVRELRLDDEDTRRRYELLKRLVAEKLGD
jgi:hypothetical protein